MFTTGLPTENETLESIAWNLTVGCRKLNLTLKLWYLKSFRSYLQSYFLWVTLYLPFSKNYDIQNLYSLGHCQSVSVWPYHEKLIHITVKMSLNISLKSYRWMYRIMHLLCADIHLYKLIWRFQLGLGTFRFYFKPYWYLKMVKKKTFLVAVCSLAKYWMFRLSLVVSVLPQSFHSIRILLASVNERYFRNRWGCRPARRWW